MNGATSNRTTALSTTRERSRQSRTAWELPALVRPLPVRHKPQQRNPRVLPHFAAIVAYMHESRFATREQIQQRFPKQLPNERTVRYQLAGLVKLGYLATMPVQSTSPNFPLVYCATPRGLRFVKEVDQRDGTMDMGVSAENVRARGAALTSLLHELLITEFDLMVHRTASELPQVDRLFVQRRYFRPEHQLAFEQRGRLLKVVPDSGFLIRYASGHSLLHFVELDNGTMPVRRILEKYQRYADWAASSEGQDYLRALYAHYGLATTKPNFRLLVIAHSKNDGADDRRLADLFTQALHLPASMRDRIWLTTASLLKQHQGDPTPLLAPIWWRARDARPWIHEFRQHVAELSHAQAKQMNAKQRAFLTPRLPHLGAHALLSLGSQSR